MWRWIRAGTFPAPIKLSANSNGWIEAEIEAWFKARMEARTAPTEKSQLANARTGDAAERIAKRRAPGKARTASWEGGHQGPGDRLTCDEYNTSGAGPASR
jgi:hypothetical protein